MQHFQKKFKIKAKKIVKKKLLCYNPEFDSLNEQSLERVEI